LKGLPEEVLITHLSFLFALPLIDCVKQPRRDAGVEQTHARLCNAESYQNMDVPYNIISVVCSDSKTDCLKIMFSHPKQIISFFWCLPSLSDCSWLF